MDSPDKENSPEVFAVVPSYNHAKFVEKCLRSIIRQTLPPKKLLVIDDGSTDDSPKIIERVLKDCPFDAELTVRENRGLCATLNQAFEFSSGKYFAYLGSDDIWLSGFLENRVELLEHREKAVLAFGHAFLIDDDDRILDSTRDWSEYSEEKFLQNLLEGHLPVTSGVVFRRSALEGLSWNEEAALEDYELYLKLIPKGEVVMDSLVLAAWRQHSHNVSSDYGKMLSEWCAAQNRAAKEIGIGDSELGAIQTRLKLMSAIVFLRRGQKAEAWKMIRENWRGAESFSEAAGVLGRFLLPTTLHKVLQERRRRARMKHYGSLEV